MAAESDTTTSDTQWGLYKTQRLALLVIATLLQQQQQHCGLMMHLVQTGQHNSEGGLCQCLLDLVDSVTRDESGTASASHCSRKVARMSLLSGKQGRLGVCFYLVP